MDNLLQTSLDAAEAMFEMNPTRSMEKWIERCSPTTEFRSKKYDKNTTPFWRRFKIACVECRTKKTHQTQ